MKHASTLSRLAGPSRSRNPDQRSGARLPAARRPKAGFAMGALLCAAMLAWSGARADTANVTLHVVSVVPKFMKFYHAAESRHLDPAERWTLWQKDYGIAAVPPGPQGKALAHKRLEKAWGKYQAAVATFPGDAARDEAAAREILPEVARLLKAGTQPIKVDLVLFVGEYSDNAYTVPGSKDRPATVYLPVEIPYERARITLAHEFTHAVHAELGHLKNMYVEPLGETVLKEGLAMHASRHIVPGGPASAYTPAMSYGNSWQKTCLADQRAILDGMRPYLVKSSMEVTRKFTFGKGTTGLHDEVYCAGWIVVGKLLDSGYTYASLARIPESGIPGFMAQAINQELTGHPAGKQPRQQGKQSR